MADDAPADPVAAASTGAADEDDNGYAPEEEAQVEFQPLVKLEEVKTQTMEEDEEVTFKMRAKLFRWESDSWEKEVKMWKERGTGDVKFLKHKETGKVRMLMRREKTMKICANFYMDTSIELKENAGSDRAWVWRCMDFSEEKSDISLLAIRFANSENAQKFKEQFEAGKVANGESSTPDAAEGGAQEGKAADAKEASKEKAPAEEPKSEAKEAPVDAN
uniref:RanBD1 domain-containing protein n=1 Tax=Haptolina brevifila TaxID=156173 RepID=A0A7S2ILC0_9EUKA|mmetsp:Transcript_67470/g.133779  ORF Transcript_67470/g.133779 Transcript_67470/m.133779 type:complete len:219 (+) Transcript_67470:94-750(+)|eukprot:CAMPEP_0174719586 /NCGR_PEP_ID=MMETSP1094-20130205/31443_1 /TAXON_ID=156173 /ORGANISM="Chrysochromulina brevifilum, Strain UTEX LB 985" /LENGTH=218 /DNA_ID=CAMNT_0015919909 /DNA_START=82 /DNA_END=738 /DNA_ORIENTATION=+